MTERDKDTAGFTLAELMMSIAIILILAAIAIPSIITAQNNMRMVELNNAAQSLANAAQTQMTAMKASGTWMDFLDKRGEAVKGKDYLLRDEARASNIIASLSIDSTVYDGDYVIEFDRSTASVTAVFYADGKSGFFGKAPATTTAARDYYADGAGSSDQAARMANDPMIGYYEGTPAGATPQVALRNPVIWVDEATGRLCVQDPNSSERDTAATVTLEGTDAAGATHAFAISGLSKGTTALSVFRPDETTSDGSNPGALFLSGAEVAEVVELKGRDGVADGDVFHIDLNALVRILAQNSPDSSVVETLNAFVSGDKVHVSAVVDLKGDASRGVPATAQAMIEWPAPVGKFSLLVSTPWSKELAGKEISGAADPGYLNASDYVQPEVKGSTTNGGDPLNVPSFDVQEDFGFKSSDVNDKLMGKNKQSGFQSYAGTWVGHSQIANDPTYVLEAAVGRYKDHYYQPWELWAQKSNGDYTRVGSVSNGVWEWANAGYANLEKGLTWLGDDGVTYDDVTGISVERIVRMDVHASGWGSALDDLDLVDEDGNVSLYLRTAPRVSEVQAYFDGKASSGSLLAELANSDTNESYDKISARGINKTMHTPAAMNFEMEFGASSSDVAWSIARDDNTGFANGDVLSAEQQAVRVYYTISPGLGFDNIKSNATPFNLQSTIVTNASLFMYAENGGNLESKTPAQFNTQVPGSYQFTSTGGATDFELKTSEDFRFYRAITYYDSDEAAFDPAIPSLYVPYVEQDVELARAPDTTVDDVDWEFVGWKTSDVKEGDPYSIEMGSGERVTVADLDDTLSYSGAKLVAMYREKPKPPVGLMYLEFNASGAITGRYGYLPDKTTVVEPLPEGNDIASSGYYVVVPSSKGRPSVVEGPSLQGSAVEFVHDGVTYYAYELKAGDAWRMKDGSVYNPRVSFTYQDPDTKKKYEGTYYVNFNFAAAVTNDESVADAWGSSDAFAWNVRTASQFVGSFPTNGNPNIQKAYSSGYHKQSHDIDLSNVARSYKFNNVFSGSFDGGGFEITGFDRAYYFYNGDAKQGFSVSDATGKRQGQGLFPYVQGSEASHAVLKNIKLALYDDVKTHGTKANAYFGLLAGVAEYADIDRCSVAGKAAEGEKRVIEVHDVSQNNGTLGGLVGLLENGSIGNAEVSDVLVEMSSAQGQWSTTMRIGGIVGLATSSGMRACTVQNAQIVIAHINVASKGPIYLGGLAGWAEGVVESGSTVSGLYFKMTYGQQVQDCVPGTVFGFASGGSRAPATTEGVTYSVLDRDVRPVTEEVGSAS